MFFFSGELSSNTFTWSLDSGGGCPYPLLRTPKDPLGKLKFDRGKILGEKSTMRLARALGVYMLTATPDPMSWNGQPSRDGNVLTATKPPPNA